MTLKIATIAPSYFPAHSYGGPIRSTLQLAQGLVRAGCEVRVLTTNTAGPQHTLDVDTSREHTLEGGVRVRYARRVLPDSVSPQLLAALPEYIAWGDVVQLVGNYNFPTFPTLLATRIADKPLFWSPRGGLQRWAGARKPQLKAAFEQICLALMPRTSVLHVTSEQEGRESSERMRGMPYVVVPNGVPIPDAARHEPNLGRLRLGYLGRLDPKKGIPILLGACALLPSLGLDNFELTIAGGGEPAYEELLHAQLRTLGLKQEVQFLGDIPDAAKADFFARIDILAMPSHTENFGIVAAEALAHAVPVIASRATPWAELVTHDCGLWIENTPEDLARAIVELSRRDLRALGERGRSFAIQAFGWDNLSARMLASYEATLALHASRWTNTFAHGRLAPMSSTAWYDAFANFYDASLDSTYREHRKQALTALAPEPGMSIVDVGCGTGASLPGLVEAVGPTGRVIGVDASAGMLRKAEARVRRNGWQNVQLCEVGKEHAPEALAKIDRVHCFLSLSVIDAWQDVLASWWQVLAPGGRFVIADVHNPAPGLYARFVEVIASASLPRKSWEPLAERCQDFNLEWQQSSWSLGGKFFVASGSKPSY